MLKLEVLVWCVLLTDLDTYLQGQIHAFVREEPDSKAALGAWTPNLVASVIGSLRVRFLTAEKEREKKKCEWLQTDDWDFFPDVKGISGFGLDHRHA